MRFDCLIIDDEQMLADNTCEYFNMFDLKTKAVYGKSEAIKFLEENETSLILLDINLGDGSGFELCKIIRETINVPILFISARNTDDDKILALNIGGDDYIEKPYSLGVLLAKVRVILKRMALSPTAPSGQGMGSGTGDGTESNNLPKDYDDGHLCIDSANRAVLVDGNVCKLTSIEVRLLTYMTENKDRLITKQELFDNVWNDRFTTDGTLNVHIRKIREEIEPDVNNPSYIVTVWKEGYRFVGRK